MARKAAEPEPAPPLPEPVVGKGRATPSRKQAQAANRRPLVPSDRKAAAKASRARVAEQRARIRLGHAAGEERYLPARDRGPQKKFARDYVDARWTVGEIFLPGVFLLFLATLVVPYEAGTFLFIAMYTFFLLVLTDGWVVARTVRRKLGQKFGPMNVERGMTLYVILRATQLRRLRLPKPQVRRGQYPT